jgi:hypothetical protein
VDLEKYRQSIVDEEHLRLLPLFYWVSGGVTAFFSLYFLVYVALGLAMTFAPTSVSSSSGSSPAIVGWFMFAIGLGGMLIVGTIATLKILTGFWIRKRRHPVMCMVAAGLSCFEMPYGTLLGVLTFIVLLRPSVSALFSADGKAAPAQPVPAIDGGAGEA